MYLTIQGIVLRVTDYNDKDALLTMLTRRHGRLTVKARGLRRKNSPLIAPCQLLAYGEFTLFEYRGQYTINEAQSIELFTPLRRDLTKLSLGTYFAQVSEVLSQEDMPNPELQSLLLNCLYALSRLGLSESQVKAVFELRAACLSGYTPDLTGCHVCGSQTPERFDLSAGMLECRNCRSPESNGIRMPVPPIRAGSHALHLLLRQQEAVFLSGGGGYLTAAFRGDGGVPRHPAGTGLFHTGFLQIVTYIGENHVRIIRKITAKTGTRSGFAASCRMCRQ